MAGKQESLRDYYEMAKEIARVERELKIERWVKIAIEYKSDGVYHRLYLYDMPVWQYEKWNWVIRWRMARFQCQMPRELVQLSFDHYKKVMETNIGMQHDLDRFVAAKAQVSKQEKIVASYIKHQKANNIFFNEETDEMLLKVRAKLQSKKESVVLAEQRLIEKVKQYQHIENVNKNHKH